MHEPHFPHVSRPLNVINECVCTSLAAHIAIVKYFNFIISANVHGCMQFINRHNTFAHWFWPLR